MLNIRIVPKGSNRPSPTGYAIEDNGVQVGFISMKTKTKWFHSRSVEGYCKSAKQAYQEWLETYVAFDAHIKELLADGAYKTDLLMKQIQLDWEE